MSFLHLGVATAVFNEQHEILLSKRGDFDVWNLPTGRLDKGEFLVDAARREVHEETGVDCRIVRPIGLYYQAGRSRLNILFEGQPTGGALVQFTNETNANAYFAQNRLPTQIFGDFMVANAFAGGTHTHVLETSRDVLKRIRRQLAWRWVKNLLSGHPEPRWARFEVQASLAVIDSTTQATLSIPHSNGERVLPGLIVNGNMPIWEQVNHFVRDRYSVYELRQATLRWVGLYQNRALSKLEFIFATDIAPLSSLSSVEWTPTDSDRWWSGYKSFVQHIAIRRPDVKIVQQA